MARQTAATAASSDGQGGVERRAARRSPSRGARIALVALGIVMSLLMAEGTLRVAGAMVPGDFQTASFLEAHPEFGRRNRPGAG